MDNAAVAKVPLVRPGAGQSLPMALLRFARSKPLGATGGLIIVALIFCALTADLIQAQDPLQQNSRERLIPPGANYVMGSDEFGRDLYSRIVHGSRISLGVGVVAVGIATILGALIGLISGYWGGRVDIVIQRFVDAIMAFPLLILAMIITSMLGATIVNVIVAISVVLTPRFSRIVRGAVLSVKETQYVDAARAIGAADRRILWTHIRPNVTAPVIIVATAALGTSIVTEASLSFLGLGTPPPYPSWGGMISGSSRAYLEVAWWIAFFPGAAITVTVLGFNLLGDALRDVWDPRLKGTK
ncbi:MAG: ABC transporter permease [Chloroflexi bacterium]|nr:ABC transporter permease [Chloroflexota bacterium]